MTKSEKIQLILMLLGTIAIFILIVIKGASL